MAYRKSNLAEAPAVSAGRELIISRVFDAPRESVWKAWTEPGKVKEWWAPKSFTTPVAEIDLRPGGRYLNCMRSPEGKDIWSTGVFREIFVPERLVMTDSFADDKGNVVPATYYGMDGDFPLEMLITVTLKEKKGKTELILRHLGIPAGKIFDECRQGWSEMFDKLAAKLDLLDLQVGVTKFTTPSDRELTAIRVVDAPREVVWDAWTVPTRVSQWMLGPEGWTMPTSEIDLRPAGKWRFVWRGPLGENMEMNGEIREIVPGERLVNTEAWGGDWPETLNTMVLSEVDGKTAMVVTVLYPSKKAREKAIGTGMKDGWSASYDRLDKYLLTMR